MKSDSSKPDQGITCVSPSNVPTARPRTSEVDPWTLDMLRIQLSSASSSE